MNINLMEDFYYFCILSAVSFEFLSLVFGVRGMASNNETTIKYWHIYGILGWICIFVPFLLCALGVMSFSSHNKIAFYYAVGACSLVSFLHFVGLLRDRI